MEYQQQHGVEQSLIRASTLPSQRLVVLVSTMMLQLKNAEELRFRTRELVKVNGSIIHLQIQRVLEIQAAAIAEDDRLP